MAWRVLIVFGALLSIAWCGELDFPPTFKFGAATASYQVEGAWNVSDKGESIWDRITHATPEKIAGQANGDVACDSYHQYKRDVQMLKEMNVHFYRFSLSWPRILPNGFTNKISEDGSRYYNDLIDELLRNDIEPVITLYHWDLPQRLQDLGGWTNPLVSDWFADYARLAFSLYGDRVKTWITINEPIVMCDSPYNFGGLAPGIKDPEVAPYLCTKHVLMAHAKAYRIYDKEFKPKYEGQVSLANHLVWFEPLSEEFKELSDLVMELSGGRYSDPVFSKEGGWPAAVEQFIAEKSKKQGYARSRLPAFTQEEKEFVRGTYDYYAFNHYTSRLVRPGREGERVEGEGGFGWPLAGSLELNAALESHPDWKSAQNTWEKINPIGIRNTINWIRARYGADIPIMITENGYCGNQLGLDDDERVAYYRDYLTQILLSIKEDGANVIGYTAWSLMDNFEWMDGYTSRWGLYEVDFEDPKRPRTPRKSVNYYGSIAKHRSLDVPIPLKHVSDEL